MLSLGLLSWGGGGYCHGGLLSWGDIVLGVIVWRGLLSRGPIVLGILLWGMLSWGYCPEGYCPGDIVLGDIAGGGYIAPGGGDILLPFWRFVLPEHHHLKVCLGERTCIYNGTTGENINYTCMSEANIIRYASRAGQGDSLLAG